MSLSSPSAANGPRFEMMDVSRGVAVLGILWLNVFLFALPFEAVVIPMIWGEHNVLNQAVWDATTIGVAGVMRGMFSILFGASALLLLTRARRADDEVTAIDRYFRRLIWLIVFGAVHAYLLIWSHDILYAYGLLGMLIFPFRHVASRKLVIVAALMIAGSSVFTSQNVEEIGEARSQAEETLSDEERERLRLEEPLVDELDDLDGYGSLQPFAPGLLVPAADIGEAPSANDVSDDEYEAFVAALAEEMTRRQEGYVANVISTAPESFQQQTTEMVSNHLLDIGAFLIVGMVLFRSGFFHGTWPPATYAKLAVGGYALGLSIGLLTRSQVPDDALIKPLADFVSEYGFDVRRLSLALANFGIVALLVSSGWLPRLRHALAACGRMALSLYISQTIVCNAIFLGYGLALFGQFEHYQLVILAVGLTIVQLVVAPLVLRRYRQGPLEALLTAAIDWGRPARQGASEGTMPVPRPRGEAAL